RFLQRTNCLARTTGGSLEVWSERSPGPARLDFLAHAEDPLFGSFTANLPLAGDAVLVLDSQVPGPADQKGRVRLHRSDCVSADNVCSLDCDSLRPILTRRDRLLPPVCIVRISIAGPQSDPLPETTWYIRFGASATRWKYYFSRDWDSGELRIVDAAD